MNEPATRHPNQFLANLTEAMRSTADTAREAALAECRSAAQARTEQLQAQTELGAIDLRAAAESDVATIGDQSKAQMVAVRAETERRVSLRRDALGHELEELNAAVAREEATVQERVTAYEGEVSRFFERLLEGADPAAFAATASQIPDAPTFDRDLTTLTADLHTGRNEASGGESGSNGTKPEDLPDHWWLDSPTKLAARIHEESE